MKTKYFLPIAIFAVICFTAFGFTFNTATLKAAPQISEKENASLPPVDSLRPSDSLRAKMEKAETHLSALETTLAKIQESRVITPEDNETLDNNGLALGDTLYAAFQEASQSTLAAAESEGKNGNAEDLPYFESFEQNHTSRTEAIVARTDGIQRGIEDGTIILKQGPATPAKFTNAGYKSETKTSLSVSPGLSETADSSCGIIAAGSKSGSKVLKPCIAPCIAQNWVECASCIIRNVPAGIQHYNQFRNCWNNCGGFWKWFCRAKCLGVFVYWIY